MRTIKDIAEEIVAREGGFVNDPADPGGATKYGVTIGTLRRLGMDLDGDNDIDIDDVKKLSREQARDIFIEHYFRRPRIALLPECVQASVFDMYVNAGGNAIKLLQQLLCDMGQVVTVDGVIGPQTANACALAQSQAPNHLRDAYGIARRNYYYRIADARSPLRKFARRRDGGKGGWIVRAEEFISARYHLTDDEHRARTVAWG
ncbi:holin-associated N-acetylmuramidase [Palleronia sp. LCG004]|uniref:holin-associated N-acetylmuramidase n=1 Tax=Palleronia sp. LCG004 TaxID=3079304 RepID=UPI0029433890|nr:holin-associated N-acetylmuramidase [Palleronia sp. LCG004]WOI57180.1 holin-associated N-acetylmuramidase [Palleronia sp. LCG004]